MVQKEVLLIVLVIISLVNAKGNYSKQSYRSSSANIIFRIHKRIQLCLCICYLGKFVCSRKANKPFKTSKIWSKSPYHGTVYYFPDTITSSGNYSAQHFLLI